MIEMEEQAPSVTGAVIAEFETQHGIKLPEDYRDFMLECNGGRPIEDWGFTFIETGVDTLTSSLICDFLSFGGEYNSLQNTYFNSVIEDGLTPTGFLPIASDPGGNTIYLVAVGEDSGSVYFGNHELVDPETGYEIMSLISGTFTEFIDGLYLCVDGDTELE
jgi:hypothetical protein